MLFTQLPHFVVFALLAVAPQHLVRFDHEAVSFGNAFPQPLLARFHLAGLLITRSDRFCLSVMTASLA
jgi:hypothetical protein